MNAFLERSPTGVRRDRVIIPVQENTQDQEYCLCPQGADGLVPHPWLGAISRLGR